MHDPTPAATDRRTLVDHYITEISSLAQKHCPEADIEVLAAPYEDEDAHIVVLIPQEVGENEMDRLSELLTKRSTELLLDTGLLILAGVYEASEQPKNRSSARP
jgi:REP element-mobilizing transposase RayT